MPLDRPARRTLLAAGALTPLAALAVPTGRATGLVAGPDRAPAPAPRSPDRAGRDREPAVAALEERYAVRVAFFAHDPRTRRTLQHRPHERRPILSLFKVLAAAAALRDLPPAMIERRLHWPATDLIEYSPITEDHVADGLTVGALCDAAIRYSDNTAGNLVLRLVGGPGGVSDLARSLGDRRTRLDRWEPELNDVGPGEVRDTTTVAAIAGSYERLLLGDALRASDRRRLTGWMLANTTSDTRFRAGLPSGWTLADKTGGGNGSSNDVGVAWSPRGRPLVVGALVRSLDLAVAPDDTVLAELMALAVRRLGG